MFHFHIFKELKRLLRRKRRWLLLATWLFLVIAAAVIGQQWQSRQSPMATADTENPLADHTVFSPYAESGSSDPQEEILRRIQNSPGKYPVVMEITYVCGEEIRQLGELNSAEILRLHEEHPQALIAMSDDGSITFTEMVDDLSPQCKDNAYFGIDAEGNLSLFDGLPQEDHVIRTFFQLNVRYLESSLPPETVQQLKKGIRVTDLAEYNSVLSTFSDYAVEETEKVLHQE